MEQKDQINNNNLPLPPKNDNLIKTINEHNNFQALESWRKCHNQKHIFKIIIVKFKALLRSTELSSRAARAVRQRNLVLKR